MFIVAIGNNKCLLLQLETINEVVCEHNVFSHWSKSSYDAFTYPLIKNVFRDANKPYK